MTDERRIRACVAALAFSLVAAVAYVAQRLLDYARGELADPTHVLAEVHTAFYWRCAVAAWWGGLAAAAAWMLVRRAKDPARTAWTLAVVAAPLGAVYVLLAWLYP